MKPVSDKSYRFSRQIKLDKIGIEGQSKLENSSVLIVGVGGLGCPAALYLAHAGVGTIGLADGDRVDLSNLHRQILFSESQIGTYKVKAAEETLSRSNTEVNLVTHREHVNEKNIIGLIKPYDVVIDGTDNFQAKYLINDACVKLDKPFVGASVFKFQGQISSFNVDKGPTYRCLYPAVPENSVNCEETGVVGPLTGILGSMQAAEALKIILGIGSTLRGKLKLVDLLSMHEQMVSFSRKNDEVDLIKRKPLKAETIHCDLHVKVGQVYLDVREPHEQPKPQQSVLKIPIDQLRHRYREIPTDREVLVYCQSGQRSEKAIKILENEFQFKNLVNVKGGINSIVK